MRAKGSILIYVPRTLLKGLTLLGLVLVIGTTGYVVIEGWQALDALYMTVITITMVGFKEVRDVSTVDLTLNDKGIELRMEELQVD